MSPMLLTFLAVYINKAHRWFDSQRKIVQLPTLLIVAIILSAWVLSKILWLIVIGWVSILLLIVTRWAYVTGKL